MTTYTKVCTGCKLEKPITEFGKRKASKDGLKSQCKSCEKQWREDNKESKAEYDKQYGKQWREDNKESRAEWIKLYYQDNKKSIIKQNAQYQSNRKKRDPLYKLTSNIRTLIGNAFKRGGSKKNSRTAQVLGCSFEEFKIHIESQFTEGMSWDNYGRWHFDHKIPVSWALTEEEIIALNHHTNFQPLWAEDNIRKGNRHAD